MTKPNLANRKGDTMDANIGAKQVWNYISNILKDFKISIFIMVGVAIIWSVDLSVRPYLLKLILDRLNLGVLSDPFSSLASPIGWYLGMSFLMATALRFYNYFVDIKLYPHLRAKIANESLDLLLDKSHHYYQNNFAGSLANKVNHLTSRVPDLIQILIDGFVRYALALTIAIVTLWQVNYAFAILILLWATGFLIATTLLSKRLTKLVREWSECESIITGKLVDVLSNSLSVRLFTGKRYENKFLKYTLEKSVKAEQRLSWAYFWMWNGYDYSFFLLQGLNFYLLCKGFQSGFITPGDFVLILVINLSVSDFLGRVALDFTEFSKLYGRIAQALDAILAITEIQDKTNAGELKITEGSIFFDRVTFHYKGTQSLFKNTSVLIKGRQKVGLVGYSGGGKTTFVNLILRLYDIMGGRILVDGQDIRDVTQDSLRRNMAMIPQDPSLFHRSISENIRYGRADATDEEVIEAAKKAHAHAFITQLPKGYDSLVGERGVKISGGQRQRIALARAILKDAPILILDEATSQLDSLTESEIQEALFELMRDKTTLVIAHRLSTLLHMDRILVFDQGTIVQDGTHSQLLAAEGTYKTLWERQIGGVLPNKVAFNI